MRKGQRRKWESDRGLLAIWIQKQKREEGGQVTRTIESTPWSHYEQADIDGGRGRHLRHRSHGATRDAHDTTTSCMISPWECQQSSRAFNQTCILTTEEASSALLHRCDSPRRLYPVSNETACGLSKTPCVLDWVARALVRRGHHARRWYMESGVASAWVMLHSLALPISQYELT